MSAITYPKLPISFYRQTDVVEIAKQLIGKYLFTKVNGVITGGKIVETEAYQGWDDKACHANNGKKTARNKVLYEEGGVAYAHLCYGIHVLLTIATNVKGKASGVLIRAIEPTDGIDTMLIRRNMTKLQTRLTAGPGCLTKALQVKVTDYGKSLTSDTLWIEDRQLVLQAAQIIATPRIGIDYAGEDAKKPWRFCLKNNKWVSKMR